MFALSQGEIVPDYRMSDILTLEHVINILFFYHLKSTEAEFRAKTPSEKDVEQYFDDYLKDYDVREIFQEYMDIARLFVEKHKNFAPPPGPSPYFLTADPTYFSLKNGILNITAPSSEPASSLWPNISFYAPYLNKVIET